MERAHRRPAAEIVCGEPIGAARTRRPGVRATAAWICLAGVWVGGCGGESASATAPTPFASVPGAVRTISGTVTDVIGGSAVPDVDVTIDRVGIATTNASGAFAVESGALPGDYAVTLAGAGVVTRRTSVSLRQHPIALTSIPSTFQMAAFEEFARSWTGGAIVRWTEAPALVIDSALVETPESRNTATARRLTDAEVSTVVTQLSRALPLLTGSTFTAFSSVDRRTTPAGQTIRMYWPGAITVVYYTEANGACGQAGPLISPSTFRIVAGAIWLKAGCASTTTMAHELGHALGYGHVSATLSVMRRTGGVDVTAFDRAAATIVFRRPPGNRAPDTDPDPSTADRAVLSTSGHLVTLPPLP